MRTILEILNLSTSYLMEKGMQHPRRQAEELLSVALEMGRMDLYLEYDRPLGEAELEKCRIWLKRRGKGEPLSYICGKTAFFDCQIKVTSDVLIPRQETEILVDKIAKILKALPLEGKSLWDIGCGSGCIGIALKKHFPQLGVVLSDISSSALAVANENALSNQAKVELLEGDFLQPFLGRKANFIVCNPPYIAEYEISTLDREVWEYEPHQALLGGKTGLEFYERLAKELPHFLCNGAKVWCEIGDGQGEEVQKLFNASCWKDVQIERDWAEKERFFSLEFE